MNQRFGVHAGLNTSHDSDNCEAVAASSLGSEWLVWCEPFAAPGHASKNEIPRRDSAAEPPNRGGEGIFVLLSWGYANAREGSVRSPQAIC